MLREDENVTANATKSPSRCKNALPVQNRPPDLLLKAK